MRTSGKSLIQKIVIPKIFDDCFLYFAEHKSHIPFNIKRVYFISKANSKLSRGYHAHRNTQQVLFCIQGSIKMIFKDGTKKQQITLRKPEIGVLIDKLAWHEMHGFQDDTILLVLSSARYNPKDYIRDYKTYLKIIIHEKHTV